MTEKGKIQPMWLAIHLSVHVLAVLSLFYFSWVNVLLLLAAHYVTMMLGMTIGYHRMITHRAVKPKLWFETLCAFFGVLCFQGGPKFWATVHRAHHQVADSFGDAHSSRLGFYWAHQNWLFHRNPNGFSLLKFRSLVRDFDSKPHLEFLERYFLPINFAVAGLALLLLPLGTWLWLFPARIVFTWHTTWLVNSVAHGLSPFRATPDSHPVNVPWINWFTLGEGYHENHHDHPARAKFSQNPGEYDVSYGFLVLMAKVGAIAPLPVSFGTTPPSVLKAD